MSQIYSHGLYVARGGNLYATGYQYSGAMRVIARFIRTTWLWDQVRVKQGAYGTFCNFEQHEGVLVMSSYRDPQLDATLAAFCGIADLLASAPLLQEEIDRGIIGTIGALDRPLSAHDKGLRTFAHYLSGITPEMRQRERDQILSTVPADFRELSGYLRSLMASGSTVVVGPQDAIAASSAGLSLYRLFG